MHEVWNWGKKVTLNETGTDSTDSFLLSTFSRSGRVNVWGCCGLLLILHPQRAFPSADIAFSLFFHLSGVFLLLPPSLPPSLLSPSDPSALLCGTPPLPATSAYSWTLSRLRLTFQWRISITVCHVVPARIIAMVINISVFSTSCINFQKLQDFCHVSAEKTLGVFIFHLWSNTKSFLNPNSDVIRKMTKIYGCSEVLETPLEWI